MKKYPEANQVISIVAKAACRPFTNSDWDAFAGCESDEPLIGFFEDMIVVVDGDCVLLMYEGDESGGEQYNLRNM
jgi:hypothetical protein